MQILNTEMLPSNRFSIFLQQISDAEFPCEQGFYFGAIFQGIHLPVMQPQDLAGGSVQLLGDVGGKKYASRSVLHDILHTVNEILPKDKPRYLMGLGTPVNILEGN